MPVKEMWVPGEKHFFFDNECIEQVQDLTRIAHRPRKHDGPLIARDQPWEYIPYFGNAIWALIHDPDEGLFRVWYEDWVLDPQGLVDSLVDITDPSVSSSRALYAVSRDGLHWEKPALGLVSEGGVDTNIVLGDPTDGPERFGQVHGPHVLDDPLEKDKSRRYKMIFQHITTAGAETDAVKESKWFGAPQLLHSPIRLAYSPDGINWTLEQADLDFGGLGPKLGDVMILSCDVRRGSYILYTRHSNAWRVTPNPRIPRTSGWSNPYYPDDPRRLNKRRIFRCESHDLIHWNEPLQILAPDDEEDNLDDSFYSMVSWPLALQESYENRRPQNEDDLYVGILNVFHQVENVLDAQLVYSRDGLNWHRTAQRQPFLERGGQGEWDEFISAVPSLPIRVGDELRIYYGGSNAHHDWWITGAREGLDVPEARDLSRVRHGIGLATLRFDGYVSLTAGSVREGLLVTRPLMVTGGYLEINAACRPGGFIQVEVSNDRDDVFDGFARDDSDRFEGDSVTHRCSWRGQTGVDVDGWVKLRFWMRDADLYSFRWA